MTRLRGLATSLTGGLADTQGERRIRPAARRLDLCNPAFTVRNAHGLRVPALRGRARPRRPTRFPCNAHSLRALALRAIRTANVIDRWKHRSRAGSQVAG